LLVATVMLFIARPLVGDLGVAPIVFSAALIVLLIVSLYAVQVDERAEERRLAPGARRLRGLLGWAFGALALVERVIAIAAPDARVLLAGSLSWMIFFGFVAWTQIRNVLRQRTVTGETISMAVSIYLLMALSWGLLYGILFELDPRSFAVGAAPIDP